MGEFWLLLALEVNRALPTYLPFSLKRNQNHTASQRQKMNCQQLLSATSKPQIYSLWKENRLMKKYWFCDFCVFYNGVKINIFKEKLLTRYLLVTKKVTDRGSLFSAPSDFGKIRERWICYLRKRFGGASVYLLHLFYLFLFFLFQHMAFEKHFLEFLFWKTYDLFFKSLAGDQKLTAVFSEEGFSSISSASASFYDSIA